MSKSKKKDKKNQQQEQKEPEEDFSTKYQRLNALITEKTKLVEEKQQQFVKTKNENTLKKEKLRWEYQKLNKLKTENEALIKQNESRALRQMNTDQNKESKKQKQSMLDKLLNAKAWDTQLLVIFNNYLDEQNRKYDKYSAFKKQTSDDEYINPYPCINVKVDIPGTKVDSTGVFRLDENTTFMHVKEIAFYYWSIDEQLKKEGQSANTLLGQLELTDETFSHIPIQENIFQFFTLRGVSNFGQVTLLLRQKKTDVDNIRLNQQEAIKISSSKGGKEVQKLDSFVVHKSQEEKIDQYKEFFKQYPGMRYYISEENIAKEEKLKQEELLHQETNEEKLLKRKKALYELDDTHCCILTLLFVLFILTIISFFRQLDTNVVLQTTQSFSKLISLDENGNFLQIRDIQAYFFILDQSQLDFGNIFPMILAKNY